MPHPALRPQSRYGAEVQSIEYHPVSASRARVRRETRWWLESEGGLGVMTSPCRDTHMI